MLSDNTPMGLCMEGLIFGGGGGWGGGVIFGMAGLYTRVWFYSDGLIFGGLRYLKCYVNDHQDKF